jgi:hypothetical protein
MKLFKSPDFRDLISEARNYFGLTFNHKGLTEQIIEKDYYVTEALRIIAATHPTQIIFKGGTSLSKGWKLINRFSEDIDLFLKPNEFTPSLSKNGIDRKLKLIEKEVDKHPGLTLIRDVSTDKGKTKGESRASLFAYQSKFKGIPDIANRILLEMGIRSGDHPTKEVLLSSYVAEFLRETKQSLNAEDESSFPMLLLHYRRTFVEKLFTIHSKVIKYKQNGTSIGTHARHYYDLFCLAQDDEVKRMLDSDEYQEIKENCHQVSLIFFSENYSPPEELSFSKSEAIFPTGTLRETIVKEYEQQCKNLCYEENYPQWEDIEACLEELRKVL